ncbi:hypothetical protein [Vibrio hepatarius]|uniref:hypothetical protein n=1 Tax=Vibrio hepatarius TaxID=171383 RepID=UPI001C098BB3|nr:hypothetical protein [Vibrio hepatarius]
MSYSLATEITVGCLAVAAYPPLQFLIYQIRGMRDRVSFERMCSVSQTCGNTVVSLGLIGTFVGLTQMIENIAGAIGGEGGSIDEQIALIMTAIGESLNAMSFAFLTSVMGVAASVMIFCASVYFKMYFDKSDKSDKSEVVTDEVMLEKLKAMEEENNKLRRYMGRIIKSQIDRKELASIVISNTLQVKALTEASGKLASSINSQGELNESMMTAFNNFKADISKIQKSQDAILKFEAGSYEKLTKINEATDNLSGTQKANASKMQEAIGAIAGGLLSIKS